MAGQPHTAVRRSLTHCQHSGCSRRWPGLPRPPGGIIFGLSSALLAFAFTRDGWWRLHLFLSGSFVMAASLGQWSPLLMLAALLPAAEPLWIVKPSIGLAALAYRPTVFSAVTGGAIMVLSVLLLPGWLPEWLDG